MSVSNNTAGISPTPDNYAVKPRENAHKIFDRPPTWMDTLQGNEVGDFFWHEEVKDWRPKLQQAVKRALEKFYGGATGQN
jgi:hypothetical protein